MLSYLEHLESGGGAPGGECGGSSPHNITIFFWIHVSPQFTTNVEYKIDHLSKTKHCKLVKLWAKSFSEHCAPFGTNFVYRTNSKNFERPYLKNQKFENWFFICFRTLCNFLYHKPNLTTFEGEGGCKISVLRSENIGNVCLHAYCTVIRVNCWKLCLKSDTFKLIIAILQQIYTFSDSNFHKDSSTSMYVYHGEIFKFTRITMTVVLTKELEGEKIPRMLRNKVTKLRFCGHLTYGRMLADN